MGDILRWPKHLRKRCTEADCHFCQRGDDSCMTEHLFTCAVCKCSEGELATHCPGELVPYELRELLYDNVLDYKNGQWINLHTGELLGSKYIGKT